jgi:hypothetical protein
MGCSRLHAARAPGACCTAPAGPAARMTCSRSPRQRAPPAVPLAGRLRLVRPCAATAGGSCAAGCESWGRAASSSPAQQSSVSVNQCSKALPWWTVCQCLNTIRACGLSVAALLAFGSGLRQHCDEAVILLHRRLWRRGLLRAERGVPGEALARHLRDPPEQPGQRRARLQVGAPPPDAFAAMHFDVPGFQVVGAPGPPVRSVERSSASRLVAPLPAEVEALHDLPAVLSFAARCVCTPHGLLSLRGCVCVMPLHA